ncbi:hypothetical protein GQ44DRAFT_821129 [Phaeosphaeriaceae sp. PMI808]|nr:hypothetical protein GQ44DRAFT_821129 [Phaeosphaeriaceae sp. PMI808]
MQTPSNSADTSPNSFYITNSVNDTDESIGKGVFAGRNFGNGEEILVLNRPLVGSLDSRYRHDTCANCYLWAEGAKIGTRFYVPDDASVQKCAGCKRFAYCSKKCQKEAWHRGHKQECKNLRPLESKDIPKAVLACMDLLTRRTHGLIYDDQWSMLCELQTHGDDFKRSGDYRNIELMAMGASEFSSTQSQFDKNFVAEMYARVLTNSLTLITPTLDPLGLILDPTLGHINHSCDPNAFVMMDGPLVSLRTLKSIKKDEEVYISYIDTTNPYHRRQSELKARWFFKCNCTKCQRGATLDEDAWVIKPQSLSKKVKAVADAMIEFESFAQDPANYVGDSHDERRVAALQGKAFAYYEEIQLLRDPNDAISMIEEAMRFCHQSGLWPLHRQPFAALRDDLIVNLISVGRFEIAWAQCAKRYKYTLAQLYPVPFHPVRVVLTWQIAMVAAYTASKPGGIGAPGVELGIIVMMLVKQVLDSCRLSHGPNSAFTRSVATKLRQIMEQLERSVGRAPNVAALNLEMETQRDMLMQMGDWIKM